ncbi:hypothetical protein Ciccas_000809 [Cichlidogyrus casuarinus]|uniref:Uncharacterized protein n=1 Tax=Cichlidogyrus casuarinus TaxID=1844966 RepID=A0ABD2QM46_9PLAT
MVDYALLEYFEVIESLQEALKSTGKSKKSARLTDKDLNISNIGESCDFSVQKDYAAPYTDNSMGLLFNNIETAQDEDSWVREIQDKLKLLEIRDDDTVSTKSSISRFSFPREPNHLEVAMKNRLRSHEFSQKIRRQHSAKTKPLKINYVPAHIKAPFNTTITPILQQKSNRLSISKTNRKQCNGPTIERKTWIKAEKCQTNIKTRENESIVCAMPVIPNSNIPTKLNMDSQTYQNDSSNYVKHLEPLKPKAESYSKLMSDYRSSIKNLQNTVDSRKIEVSWTFPDQSVRAALTARARLLELLLSNFNETTCKTDLRQLSSEEIIKIIKFIVLASKAHSQLEILRPYAHLAGEMEYKDNDSEMLREMGKRIVGFHDVPLPNSYETYQIQCTKYPCVPDFLLNASKRQSIDYVNKWLDFHWCVNRKIRGSGEYSNIFKNICFARKYKWF